MAYENRVNSNYYWYIKPATMTRDFLYNKEKSNKKKTNWIIQARVSYTIYIFMNVYNRLPDVRRWHVVTNVLIGRISDYFPAPSRIIMDKHNRYWTKFGKKTCRTDHRGREWITGFILNPNAVIALYWKNDYGQNRIRRIQYARATVLF